MMKPKVLTKESERMETLKKMGRDLYQMAMSIQSIEDDKVRDHREKMDEMVVLIDNELSSNSR